MTERWSAEYRRQSATGADKTLASAREWKNKCFGCLSACAAIVCPASASRRPGGHTARMTPTVPHIIGFQRESRVGCFFFINISPTKQIAVIWGDDGFYPSNALDHTMYMYRLLIATNPNSYKYTLLQIKRIIHSKIIKYITKLDCYSETFTSSG
jgi:hypothetical protein